MKFSRGLAVASIGCGMVILGMVWSIVNTALASIQKEFSADVAQLQWVMNSFGIGMCVFLLTMGKLGDAYGRKLLFVFGLCGALCASLIAGFSQQIEMVIVSMGLFGLSGSIILPLSQALLVHQFPEEQKETPVGLWSMFASLSLACGPLVGGLILNYWGWRWIFWINIPFILLNFPFFLYFVKNETDHNKPKCNWTGVIFLALIICSFVLAIMQGPLWGWTSDKIIGLFVFFLVALCVFIFLERHSKYPLFDSQLFLKRSFIFSAIPNAFMVGFVWVVFFLIPLYMQNLLGFTALHAGLLLLAVTIPVISLSFPVSRLYRTVGPKRLIFTGFLILGIAALSQAVLVTKLSIIWMGVSCIAIGLGWVMIWGPSISCALMSLPHSYAGIASGMFATLQELGAVLSLSLAGVVFRTVHTNIMQPQLETIQKAVPSLSHEQLDSLLDNPIALKEMVGNQPFLSSVRDAFLQGYEGGFWFLFCVAIFSMIVCLLIPKLKAKNDITI